MSKITWHIELKNLSDLHEWPDNPRILTEKGIKDLTNSVHKFGCCEPIIINIDNTICGGHGRKKVLESLKVETVDCYLPSRMLTIEEFKELNLRLNKNIAGEFDFEKLLNNFDIELLHDVGFEDCELDLKINREDIKEDEIPDVNVVDAIAKLGDVWQLGRHKIICGDCRNVEIMDKLFDDKKCDQVLTDPPYGVDYSSKNEMLNKNDKRNRNTTPIVNDNIKNYRQFFSEFLSIIPFNDYNTIYIFMSGKELHNLRLALDDCNITCGDYLVWVKNNNVLSRKDYKSKHEFCVYGWKNHHKFYGDFSTTILEFDRPIKNDLHPTMKPIALLVKLIQDGSQKNNIVYDGFLGSGSTLIACEQTNRICYGCEIEPHYIDVIIAWWEKFTNQKAKLIT